MLVAIEGIDGSGKATQAKLLSARMGAALFSFPAYDKTVAGPMIKKYLKGEMGSLYANNPFLVSLLYALDRQEVVDTMGVSMLHGDVVCDRYVHSNVAHQCAKLYDGSATPGRPWLQLANDIERIEFDALCLPEADLVIYLDLTAEQSYARTHARDTEADIHQDDLAYLAATREVYLYYARTYKAWRLVKCFDDEGNPRSVEDIHAEICVHYIAARNGL